METHKFNFWGIGGALMLAACSALFADLTAVRMFCASFLLLLGLTCLFRAGKPHWFITSPRDEKRFNASNVLEIVQVPPCTRWGIWTFAAIAILALSGGAAYFHFNLFDGKRSQPVIGAKIDTQAGAKYPSEPRAQPTISTSPIKPNHRKTPSTVKPTEPIGDPVAEQGTTATEHCFSFQQHIDKDTESDLQWVHTTWRSYREGSQQQKQEIDQQQMEWQLKKTRNQYKQIYRDELMGALQALALKGGVNAGSKDYDQIAQTGMVFPICHDLMYTTLDYVTQQRREGKMNEDDYQKYKLRLNAAGAKLFPPQSTEGSR